MHASTTVSSRLNRLLLFIEQDAGNLKLRKDAVQEACDTGQWETARRLIDAGLQSHPEDAELLALSGFAYLQAQLYVDAELALSAARERGLQAPEIRYNLAFAWFMQKRYGDALDLLADPLITQAMPFALLLRARCLHHLGRHDEAIVDCRAHLVAAPDDADTHGVLGLLLHEQQRNEEAKEHVAAALQRNPQQLEAMLASASMQSQVQDHHGARVAFDALLQAHPECGRGWLGLALLELNDMRFAAAKLSIAKAAMHMPDHIGTWHVLAWIQLMLGDVVEAEVAFECAFALDRNFAETHGGLAVVAALQGRDEDARTSMKRALRLDPQSMSPRYAEMLLLQRAGKNDEARAVLENFLSRPVAQSDMQYRDLVALQMKHLRTLAEESASAVHH